VRILPRRDEQERRMMSPSLTPDEAIGYLRRLVALDGPFFPCLDDCGHDVCELGSRVLSIVDRVR
jgi:hypothetical protein